MRRIGVILSLSIIMVLLMSTVAFGKTFDVEKTSPKDGATGMSVENMGVKVYFTDDVYSEKNEKYNASLCKITDAKGKVVPTRVVFSKDNKKVMLVLATPGKKGAKIEGDAQYNLTIAKGYLSAKGAKIDKEIKVSYRTLNPQTSMIVSMVMMGVMVVGMIFFTSREAKKQMMKDDGKAKEERFNPYKVAKETGKSVEEVIAAEKKKQKRRGNIEAAKNKLTGKGKDSAGGDEEEKINHYRVKKRQPNHLGGGKFRYKKSVAKVEKKTAAPQGGQKTTNPKNRTGKQKNKGKK